MIPAENIHAVINKSRPRLEWTAARIGGQEGNRTPTAERRLIYSHVNREIEQTNGIDHESALN
jgi:hypothetical protein